MEAHSADSGMLTSPLGQVSVMDCPKMTDKLKCLICGKFFAFAGNLVLHVQIHTSHRCEQCGELFPRLSDFNKHRRSHKLKTSHHCKVCKKSFTHANILKSHLVLQHGISQKRTTHRTDACKKKRKSSDVPNEQLKLQEIMTFAELVTPKKVKRNVDSVDVGQSNMTASNLNTVPVSDACHVSPLSVTATAEDQGMSSDGGMRKMQEASVSVESVSAPSLSSMIIVDDSSSIHVEPLAAAAPMSVEINKLISQHLVIPEQETVIGSAPLTAVETSEAPMLDLGGIEFAPGSIVIDKRSQKPKVYVALDEHTLCETTLDADSVAETNENVVIVEYEDDANQDGVSDAHEDDFDVGVIEDCGPLVAQTGEQLAPSLQHQPLSRETSTSAPGMTLNSEKTMTYKNISQNVTMAADLSQTLGRLVPPVRVGENLTSKSVIMDVQPPLGVSESVSNKDKNVTLRHTVVNITSDAEIREFRVLATSSTTEVVEDVAKTQNPWVSGDVPGDLRTLMSQTGVEQSHKDVASVAQGFSTNASTVTSTLPVLRVQQNKDQSQKAAEAAIETAYKCSHCGLFLRTASALRHHEKTHAGKTPFQCKICSCYFNLAKHLRAHELTHKNIRSVKNSEMSSNKISNSLKVETTSNVEQRTDIDEQTDASSQGVENIVFIQHTRNMDYDAAKEHERNTAENDSSCQCEHCGEKLSSQKSLQRHLLKHSNEEPFKCDICPKSYHHLGHLKAHQKVHDDGKIHNCEVCGLKFDDHVLYLQHVRTHSTKTEKGGHKCEVCEKTFTQASSLRKHSLIHSCSKPFICEMCGRSFAQSGHLKTHLLTHSDPDERKGHICSVCGKSFSLPSSLTRHLRIHSNERPYECPHCPATFNQPGHLKTHLWQHKAPGTRPRPYACLKCNRTFTTSTSRNNHIATHTGERRFQCDVCLKRFMQSSALQQHVKIHRNEKPYECEVCHKRFTQKQSLDVHFAIHSGLKRFQCHICGKKFTQSAHLTAHMRIHTEERPYACEHCSQRFVTSSARNSHQLTHSDIKSFQCTICGKLFSRQTYLNVHMFSHTQAHAFMCKVCGKTFRYASSLSQHCRGGKKGSGCTGHSLLSLKQEV